LVVLFVILYRGAFLWDIPSGNGSEDPTIHYTMVFNTFVFMQVFNEINSRKVGVEMNVFKGFFTNFLFVGVIAFTTVVQILVVEFGGRFTMTTHLPFNMWLWSIGLGLLCVPYGFLLRLIPVPLEPFEKPSADGISSELAFLAHRDTEKQSSSPANSPGMIKLQV
jgi:magnesium-transporting ATPase (P-type)